MKVNRQFLREAIGAAGLPSKPAKYRNCRFVVDGVRWDSRKEYARWLVLVRLREQGLIRGLRRQQRFAIKINGELICVYVSDFSYYRAGEFIVEDVKSEFTRKLPVYRLKAKLMRAVWKIEIREI